MKVFIDTNVLLDVLGNRPPFYDDAAAIWTLAEQRKLHAVISAVSLTNIFYIINKLGSRAVAIKAIRQLSNIFSIAACDEKVNQEALELDLKDFEDAVQLITATHSRAKCLITRNPSHFPNDSVPILTPAEFLIQDDIQTLIT